jgi:hypothetical protein
VPAASALVVYGGLLRTQQIIEGEADSPVAQHPEDRITAEGSPSAQTGTDPECDVEHEQGASDRGEEWHPAQRGDVQIDAE